MPDGRTELVGILPVDKPSGPTSHDVVAEARRGVGIRRVGHTGTLDPFASGLLLLCLGRATRLAEYLTGLPKRYEARMRLGEATDTDDRTGTVIRRVQVRGRVDEEEIGRALAGQVGEIVQQPPLFSAKRVAGERMHRVARAGGSARPEPVEVRIHALRVVAVELPDVTFEVECGAGTYVRAIARDVGHALGLGAHLRDLRRTRIGSFRVEDGLSLDSLASPEAVRTALITPAEAMAHLPGRALEPEELRVVRNGGWIPGRAPLPEGEPLALVGPDGALVAVGERRAERIRPRKVLG